MLLHGDTIRTANHSQHIRHCSLLSVHLQSGQMEKCVPNGNGARVECVVECSVQGPNIDQPTHVSGKIPKIMKLANIFKVD